MVMGMYLRKGWFLVFLCGCLLALPVKAADIQVGVDRNPVNLNESFQITFSASEEPDSNPDFSPLEEHFQILNQQRSSNVSWINGKSSRSEQWLINVMAKQAGDLLIPPIAFGADLSKPLPIKVTDAPQPASDNDDEVFLDVQATPEKPYAQSQVLYTLKLYRRVQITQASLSEPEVKDSVVEKLGEDNTHTTQINGVDYWVTERKYAIFPQQSGLVTIAPLTLTAEVVTNQRPRFNGFFNHQFTETRRISSKAVTLNVQPVPQGFKGSTWLSAESLELTENWSDKQLQSKVGEPLTRTIRLLAKGTTVGQLPELAGQIAIDGLKTYPDQPVLNEEKQGDGLTAVREEKIAYIPGRDGDFTLPALSIPWFNTRTQTMEVAHLSAATLRALPVAGTAQPVPLAPKTQAETIAPASATGSVTAVIDAGFWPWLSGLLALGWMLNVLWLYRRRTPATVDDSPRTEPDTTASSAGHQLKKACATNDPRAARQALLIWARARFGLDNLNALAHACGEPLAGELLQLNRLSYAGQPEPWNGDALWRAFNAQRKTPERQTSEADPALEPLFKL